MPIREMKALSQAASLLSFDAIVTYVGGEIIHIAKNWHCLEEVELLASAHLYQMLVTEKFECSSIWFCVHSFSLSKLTNHLFGSEHFKVCFVAVCLKKLQSSS